MSGLSFLIDTTVHCLDQNKEKQGSLENSALKKANHCLLEVINKHVKHHQNLTKTPKVDGVVKKMVQLLEENNKDEVVTLLISSKSVFSG